MDRDEKSREWLRALFVRHPLSVQIAARLTRGRRRTCRHGRAPCFLTCGVKRDEDGRWVAIRLEERLEWLEDVIAHRRRLS
jgi:hypothetical protein